MQIAVLGPLEVSTDHGRPVRVPGAQERLLLAVLAAGAPAAVSTERLVEVLWDGRSAGSADEALHALVVRLRSCLEPGLPPNASGRYVVRRGHGYVLTVARGDLDALRMEALVARGSARLAAGDAAEAARLLSAALHLWRGDAYADWPDATFARDERRRLGALRTDAATGLDRARRGLADRATGGPGRLPPSSHPVERPWDQSAAVEREGQRTDGEQHAQAPSDAPPRSPAGR